MGTILAVTLIFVFLAWIVLPMFSSPSVGAASEREASEAGGGAPFHLGVDGQRLLAWTLEKDGELAFTSLVGGTDPESILPFGSDSSHGRLYPVRRRPGRLRVC